MSLLQGLLGFGAGAAGAFAEQKKADIDAQRKANLARLQAQYKGEVAQRQTEQTADLIGQARGGDQRASDLLTAQGVEFDPKGDGAELTTAMQTEKQRVAYYQKLYGMSEQEAARFARLGERDRYAQIAGRDNLYYDSVTEAFGSFVDNRFVPVDPQTGDYKIPEQHTGKPTQEQESPPESLRRGENQAPVGRGLNLLSRQIMESPIPPNVVSETPGIGPGTKRLITNFSFIGDLYEEYKNFYAEDKGETDSGINITPENEAKIIFNGYKLKVTEFFARDLQEEGRLQSMILEMVQEMNPTAGLFSSQKSVEDGLASIGKEIAPRVAELEEELDPSQQSFYRMSDEERSDKRKRLSALNEIYEDTEAMLAGQVANNTLVPMPSGQNKPVAELNLEEVTELQNQYDSNPSILDTRQKTALSYWWGLYARSRRSAGAR